MLRSVFFHWGLCAWLLVFFAGPVFAQQNLPAEADSNAMHEATSQLGSWIWDARTFDKQSCRFWRSFVVPAGATVSQATLRITVDNSYRLFLDGREIGRGSDWRTLTEYDLKWLLNPGEHVLAVEAFNDRLAGGFIFSLQIGMIGRPPIRMISDTNWLVVPLAEKKWERIRHAKPDWLPARIVGGLGTPPWNNWPYAMLTEPALRPILVPFWQTTWFQIAMLVMFGLLVLLCLWLVTQLMLQSKAQRLLQLQRSRIARDIHDDLGARLTQLVLLGEFAQSELPVQSETRVQIDRICVQARELAHAMDEVVWAVSSRRDTLPDFAAYVCKYAQLFLNDTPIRCWLDVEPELPPAPFDLAIRRNLLLAVKEAISNAAKHSGATELFLRIHLRGGQLSVVVQDNGGGFDPNQNTGGRNGLINMAQRMEEVGGLFKADSAPGMGCRVEFNLPLTHARRRPQWLDWLLSETHKASELENPRVAEAERTEQN